MPNGAEVLVATLAAHNVEYVFGVCGDTSVDLYRAFSEQEELTHVLARDERSAAYMADAYARLSDKPGICEGPSGGGATYQLAGVSEANESSVPVVSMNTSIPIRYRDRGVLTELDQKALYDTVTKWNTSVDHAEQVPRLLRQAFRETTTGRPGATHLSFPMNVLNDETDAEVYADENAAEYPPYRPTPEQDRLKAAASLLAESERPVVVAGGGIHASRAWHEVRAFAEQVGLPVGQTLTSAGCIGDSPYSIGVVGENGSRRYANEIVREADTLLLLGTAVESVWTNKWSQPSDGAATVIHADIEPASIGKNYDTEVALPGDLRKTVEALGDLVGDIGPMWDPADLQARHDQWIREFEDAFDADDVPLRPERVVADAASVLEEDAVLVSDPGTPTPYFASLYPFSEPGRHWVVNRAHGELGYAIPGAVGAACACPDQQVVALSGDGSFGIAGTELETYSRLDLPITVVVFNNNAFSWIEAGQQNYSGFSFGVEFSSLDHAAIAEEYGVAGFRVESAEEFEDAFQAAIEVDGPSLVDVPTQPLPSIDNVPVDWLEPEA
ncbi:thiamine pyrophosphate-binding protein [Halorussus salinisoli]|uniref:thiamine pyrophosphate-binding protein n=1 Tax=Halorussus salinisoli TaxID=2558242 RepID=UPI0010C21CA2|nr:thiamine pyrophosphate-binding protein [Halorussus salinisoli]